MHDLLQPIYDVRGWSDLTRQNPHTPRRNPPATQRELACRLELSEARGSMELEQNSLSIEVNGSPHIWKSAKRINWSRQEAACFL